MSFSVDVNILLYASNRDCVEHERAVAFLDTCLAGPELFCVAWTTIMGYLRMSTHPGIFPSPLAPAAAQANIDRLLNRTHVRAIGEVEGFWPQYLDVCGRARGNDVPDAHLAAVLRTNDVSTLYTNDDDFRRYAFLKIKNPLATAP